MKIKIPSESLSLLKRILTKHMPEMVPQVNECPSEMSKEDRTKLIELLSMEFSETGLDSDEEPNEHGLAIEALLDIINRCNIK